MKKLLRNLFAVGLVAMASDAMAQRYLQPVFTDIKVDKSIMYGANISVLTGAPKLDTLYMDVYSPNNDTTNKRPLVVYLHTGSFLPPIVNGSPTGSRKDSATVAMCQEFAKRGYVVAAISYRLGWNPQGNQQTRTGTILNAVYRQQIDAKTAIRFFRRNLVEGGNTWGVDTSRIVMVGQGTGGYGAMAAASLTKNSELLLDKFIDFTTTPPQPYVLQGLAGNLDGTDSTFLNVRNHANYSSKFNMAVNMAGALGDSSWMEPGEVPVVAFHSYNDPFAPFNTGIVLVPGTTFQVLEVSGSNNFMNRANRLGNNAVLNDGAFLNAIATNPYQQASLSTSTGVNHLFRMCIAPASPQAGPWDFWDSTIVKQIVIGPFLGSTAHSNSMMTNPNMSKAKSMAYVDTVQGYLAPRMVQVLGLPGKIALSAVSPDLKHVTLSVYPNPVENELNVMVNGEEPVSITLFDISGRVVADKVRNNSNNWNIPVNGFAKGVYILKVRFDKGEMTKKVIVK